MKKRKLCMIFLLCLALMTLVAGCRSKKETNDQGNQKGTAIYYTNNDVTKLIMKKENVKLEGNQQQKVKILLKKLQQTPKSDKIRSVIPKRIMINGVSVNTNIVEIDFSTGYKRISENRDLICRAGIVYTLTQLKISIMYHFQFLESQCLIQMVQQLVLLEEIVLYLVSCQ